MKENRYLIRLANTGPYHPKDQATLLSRIREIASSSDRHVMNLRVSSRAIEFDFFCASQAAIDMVLPTLSKIGPLLTHKRLQLPEDMLSTAQVIREAQKLFNEERYWEVHEVLEDVWKVSKGPERELVQGLILAAAALVHVQKNEPDVVKSMLRDALRRLESKPDMYHDWNIKAFREKICRWLSDEEIVFEKI